MDLFRLSETPSVEIRYFSIEQEEEKPTSTILETEFELAYQYPAVNIAGKRDESRAVTRKGISSCISREARDAFACGYEWVQNHQKELIAAGWTRAELCRRSRLRYPVGNWGLAWLNVWLRPGCTAGIARFGRVVFTFYSHDRKIKQTASPSSDLKNFERSHKKVL